MQHRPVRSRLQTTTDPRFQKALDRLFFCDRQRVSTAVHGSGKVQPVPETNWSGFKAASRSIAMLGAAAITILLLAGCGGSSTPKTVDPTHVEQAIARSVKAQRHLSASVTCPSGMPLRKGAGFYCVAQDGTTITTFAVTETDNQGAVRYLGLKPSQVPELDTTAIEASIAKSIATKRQLVAKVACPSGIPRQKGLPFVCTATAAGKKAADFVVDQHNDSGRVSFSSH
jgi:Domain of unknown function (DUF4333)